MIPMRAPSDSPGKAPSMETSPRLRVLLIEDCPDLAEVTAEFLSGEGLDVRTALTGREALDVAPLFLPQLVLCDLNLPDMTGLEVVRALRSSPATARSCLVILTAMQRPTLTQHEPEQADIDAFIPKPITIETIGKLMARAGQRGRNTDR